MTHLRRFRGARSLAGMRLEGHPCRAGDEARLKAAAGEAAFQGQLERDLEVVVRQAAVSRERDDLGRRAGRAGRERAGLRRAEAPQRARALRQDARSQRILPMPGCGVGAPARREREDVERCERQILDEAARLVEVGVGFAGESRDEVGREVEARIRARRALGERAVTRRHDAAPHPLEDGERSRLKRQMEVRNDHPRSGDEVDEVVAASRVVVPHLHLPLQSGSFSVLKRMRRGIVPARYRALAERAARANPRLHLATDLIAGFPGETDADFDETCRFVEDLPFASLHVFPFSPRGGTDAAAWHRENPLASGVLTERTRALRRLGAAKARAFAARAAGTTAEIVTLSGNRGLTDHYLEVSLELPLEGRLPGRRLQARLVSGAAGMPLEAHPC